jgi:hypothetical protein
MPARAQRVALRAAVYRGPGQRHGRDGAPIFFARDRPLMRSLAFVPMPPLCEAILAAYHAEQTSTGVLVKGMIIDRADDVVPQAVPRGLGCRPPSLDGES